MVADTLAKEKAAVAAQYAAQVDDSGPFCRIHSQWESQAELLDKRAVMALWEPGFKVVIGDSYTDVLAAQQADLVFARDRLAEALQKSGQPYYPFDTFYDILNVLNKILLEQEGRSMRELECKLRCTPADHARVRESCEKMGLVRQDEIRELDQYYTTENRNFLQEDRALRLRRVQKGLEQMCKITYKGPNRTPGIQDREELETRVEDGETAARILSALGCRVLAQVDKRRETYRLEPLSVCLDQVAELGSFVEVELLSEEENVERLEEIRRELGLEAAQLEGRTYLELILRGEGR